MYTLKIPFTLYTCVFAKVLQNGAKFIQKLTPGFKNHRNLNKFKQEWKVQNRKSWNLIDLCPKSKFLQLKHVHTEDLSNITFNYLCKNLPNYWCHSWNDKSFFTTQLLCIFLARTLHIFFKSCPWKVRIFRLSSAQIKFHEITRVIFQIKRHFFFKMLIFFQCHEKLFFCTFLAETLYAIDK